MAGALVTRAVMAAVALGVFGLVGWALAYGYFRTYTPSSRTFPVWGVDVSHHQGAIAWDRVAGDGVDFAYIKATEGGDFTDRRFAENWRAAGAAGIARGAYHFFTFCRPGIEQAAHVIAIVPKEAGALPLAIDLEFGGNCAPGPNRLDIETELAIFEAAVGAHYGQTSVIYATREFYEDRLAGAVLDNPLWLRSLLRQPSYARQPWTFWQYHNRGRVDGVTGPVDRNVFYASEAEFARWRAGNSGG